MKKRKLLIALIGIALFFAAMSAIVLLTGHVTMNPEGTVGNTAGNLNNRGLFCEYNGTVYFSNPLDGGTLYRMKPDESGVEKLNEMKVCNILAGGKYLYYFQFGSATTGGFGSVTNTHALNRCNLNGKKAVGITRDVVTTGQLVDNYLYLLTAGSEHPVFYKIKIDRTNQVHLADYAINPACAENGQIYYSGTQDNHYLYSLNTATDVPSIVWEGNLCYPVLDGDYIYYMDISANYRLCRYSLTNRVVEVLTRDRVDCFNVGGGYIYYQKNSATQPQLICMYPDGSNPVSVADGNFTNINMTSQYVYFQEYGEDESLYHVPLGSIMYSSF